jgi:hypothetical protein
MHLLRRLAYERSAPILMSLARRGTNQTEEDRAEVDLRDPAEMGRISIGAPDADQKQDHYLD